MLPGYASSWTLAGTGGHISWKQQSIQSSDREDDSPFGSVLINALVLTDLATFRVVGNSETTTDWQKGRGEAVCGRSGRLGSLHRVYGNKFWVRMR